MKFELIAAIAVLAMSVAACSDTVTLAPGLPGVPVPDAIRVVQDVDAPANVIERGLSDCDGRVAATEAACLKKALTDEKMTVSALVATMPGCRTGAICHYQYTTVDRVGFVSLTQSNYKVRWSVDIDLRKKPASIANVPVTVTAT